MEINVAQASTTGAGTGATFQLTFGDPRDQRVILTNQEFALLNYTGQVTDENLFDTLFQTALTNVLGAQLCMALIQFGNRTNNRSYSTGARGRWS